MVMYSDQNNNGGELLIDRSAVAQMVSYPFERSFYNRLLIDQSLLTAQSFEDL